MVIPAVKTERLYQKIANIIIQLINDNIFPPGSFLPPERELAKQLGVSRASLREALIVLEISGFIVIQSGNGVIVADKTLQTSDYSIDEILYSRELVDSHCAKLAALHSHRELTQNIRSLYESMAQAIKKNNVRDFYSLDKKFHLAISEASQNRVLHQMSSLLWEQRVNIPYAGLEARSSDKKVLLTLNEQHLAIVEAIEQSDTEQAWQTSHNHLAYVKDLVKELTSE